jgi:hypothetical protein
VWQTLRIATIENEELLLPAAVAALQPEERAAHVAAADDELSRVEHVEAAQLREIFHQLMPELHRWFGISGLQAQQNPKATFESLDPLPAGRRLNVNSDLSDEPRSAR